MCHVMLADFAPFLFSLRFFPFWGEGGPSHLGFKVGELVVFVGGNVFLDLVGWLVGREGGR